MARPTLVLLLIFALAACAIATDLTTLETGLFSPPYSSIAEHNTAIAPDLLGFHDNIGNVQEDSNPTIDYPFYWTDIHIFNPVPAVNHTADSKHPPKILWGWGEEHPGSIYTDDGSNPDCGAWWTRSTIHDVTLANVRATTTIVSTSRIAYLSDEGPNPFQTGMSQADFDTPVKFRNKTIEICIDPLSAENDYTVPDLSECRNKIPYNVTEATPLNLTVVLTAEWRIERETIIHHPVEYSYCCDDECKSICHACTDDVEIDSTLVIPISVSETFGMHNGNSASLVNEPVLDLHRNVSQLMYSVFSLRNYTKYYPIINGKLYNALYIHNFYTAEDPYGVRYVMLEPLNSMGLTDGDPDAAQYLPQNETSHRLNWWFLETNALKTYADQHAGSENYTNAAAFITYFSKGSEMQWSDTPGYVVFDYFGDPHTGSFTFSHTKATAFIQFRAEEAGSGSGILHILFLDEDEKPVPSAVVDVTLGSEHHQVTLGVDGTASFEFPAEGTGSVSLSAVFAGLSGYKPAHAATVMVRMPVSDATSNLSFSGLAQWPACIAIALLGLFIGVAYTASGHVFGTRFIMSIADTLGAMAIASKMGAGNIAKAPASIGRSGGKGASKPMIRVKKGKSKAQSKNALTKGKPDGSKAAGKPKGKDSASSGKDKGIGGLAGGKDSRMLVDRRNKMGMAQNRAKKAGAAGAGKKQSPEQRLNTNLTDRKKLGNYNVVTSKGSQNEALNKRAVQAARGDTLDYVGGYKDAAGRIRDTPTTYHFLNNAEFDREFVDKHTENAVGKKMQAISAANPTATQQQLDTVEKSLTTHFEQKYRTELQTSHIAGFVDPTSAQGTKDIFCRDDASIKDKYTTSVHETLHVGGGTNFSKCWKMHEGPTEMFSTEISNARGLYDGGNAYPKERASYEFMEQNMPNGREAIRESYFNMSEQRLRGFVDNNCGTGAFDEWAKPAPPQGSKGWSDPNAAADQARQNLERRWTQKNVEI